MTKSKYPRHDFWGAGEPDCPKDLKAPNGELCDMRCKVCGDGWRHSVNVCMAQIATLGGGVPGDHNGAIRAALAELVAVKEVKDRAEALHFIGPNGDLGEGWKAEYDRLRADYIRRQPAAWDAARAALGGVPGGGK